MKHEIATVAALREVIGEPIQGLAEKNTDRLDEYSRSFIQRAPFAVLSTSDAEGRIDASPKGDAPGFVEIIDDKHVAVPDRPGNRLAYGHENIIANPRVGLLFVIPGTSETLRINGRATLTNDPELLDPLAARGKPAVLAVVVEIEECFFHCGKAFIRSKLWQPKAWGEPYKVSFGQMYAARKGGDEQVAAAVDAAIEADYVNNL